ncbi:MAG: hypothetical protein U0324_09955 [Polyangiales bacterium]
MITPWETPALDGRAVRDARDVRALAASPDGRSLWGALFDRVVCWEVPSGRVLATLPAAGTSCLVVGDGVVVTGGPRRIRWTRDASGWRPPAPEPMGGTHVLALALPAEATLSSGFRRGSYWGANPRRMETAFEFVGVAMRDDGSATAALGQRPGNDDRLVVFDANGEEVSRVSLGPQMSVLAWAGDDVLVGGARGLVRCNPRRRRAVWSRTSLTPFALATSRDGAVAVALLSQEGAPVTAVFLRASDGAALGAWAFTRAGLRWGRDGDLRAVDAGATLDAKVNHGAALAVAPDGSWCALACEQGVAVLGADGAVVAAPRRGFGSVRAAEWTPDGRVVVAYSNAPSLHVVRPGAGDVDLAFEHDGESTYELYPSPDGRAVAVHAKGTGDHGLRLHNLRDGAHVELRAEGLSHVEWVEWTDAGDALWVACWWQRPTNEFTFELWRVSLTAGDARRVWARAGEVRWRAWFRALHRVGPALYAALPWACLDLDPATGAVLRERPWASPPFCLLDDDRALSNEGRVVPVPSPVVRWPAFDADDLGYVRAVSPSRAWALLLAPRRPNADDPAGRGTLVARATEGGAHLARFEVPNGWRARLRRDGAALAAVDGGALRLYRVDADALDAAARAAGG